MAFIRVSNSQSGAFDVDLGVAGQVLVSNGPDVAPTFQDMAVGSPLRGFSYTQDWEKAEVTRISGYDFGMGNFTAEFERTLLSGSRHGPASYTSPCDFPWTKRI